MEMRVYSYCKLVCISIKIQKMMLEKYALEHGFTIYDYYIDDGYSGLNFERLAFKRLMQDISDGKINLVLTKDLSRLGRNHIQTSYFIEIFFPDNDIRYIAVNDNVDTLYDNNDKVNIVHFYHLKIS